MYKLYVIPGSHACRSAMLMLGHKRVRYERIDLITVLHPLLVRLHGFDAGGQTRTAGTRRTLMLRLGDLLGTVPALAAGDEHIATNYRIARFLDDRHPEPRLLPRDSELRPALEQVELWANETLQMVARRVLAGAALEDPVAFARSAADGRLGYLLYRSQLARRLIIPILGRFAFAAGRQAQAELLAELPATLDGIDGWIARGVLGGPELNVADFMIAPSLALMLYRADVRSLFEGRPALALVDRLLPEAT